MRSLQLEIFGYGSRLLDKVIENYYTSDKGLHYRRGGTCYSKWVHRGCVSKKFGAYRHFRMSVTFCSFWTQIPGIWRVQLVARDASVT